MEGGSQFEHNFQPTGKKEWRQHFFSQTEGVGYVPSAITVAVGVTKEKSLKALHYKGSRATSLLEREDVF